jgi:hypothetical protein
MESCRRRTPAARPHRPLPPLLLFLGVALLLLGGGLATPRAVAQSTDPSVVGEWRTLSEPWPFRAIHMQMLPTGKVMFWTRYPEGYQPRLWDPATDMLGPSLPSAGWQEFCASQSLLADGTLLIAGGHVNGDGDGAPYASVYDPFTNAWTRQPDMNAGRWYPTSVTLGNGEVVVVAGSYNTSYANNTLPQVWSQGIWRDLTGATRTLPLYPDLHLAPNGKVFMAGPNRGACTWTRTAPARGRASPTFSSPTGTTAARSCTTTARSSSSAAATLRPTPPR